MSTPPAIASQVAAGAIKAATKPALGYKRTRIHELDEKGERTGKSFEIEEAGAQASALELALLTAVGAAAVYFLAPRADGKTTAQKRKDERQAKKDAGDILPSGSPLDVVGDFLTGKGI